MRFFDTGDFNIIGYSVIDTKSENKSTIVVLLNPYNEIKASKLPEGEYKVILSSDGKQSLKSSKTSSGSIEIDAISAVVLLKK